MFMDLYSYYYLIWTDLSLFIIENITLHFRAIYNFSSLSQNFSPLYLTKFFQFFII